MRHHVLTLVAIGCLAAAAPCEAQVWRWLERLSGPGDFLGLQYDQKIFCDYEDAEAIAAKEHVVPAISAPCLNKGPRKTEPLLERRIYAAGLGIGYMRALSNGLDYAPTATHVDRTVQVVVVEAFFDHRLAGRNYLDVGVAVGFNRFIVPEVDDFTRVSIEPRVTAKLVDLRRGDRYIGTFGIRAGVLIFTKGFKDTDFGAIPGTYDSGTEIGPSIRFVLDFDANPFKSSFGRARSQR